jgi:hypothetical protein
MSASLDEDKKSWMTVDLVWMYCWNIPSCTSPFCIYAIRSDGSRSSHAHLKPTAKKGHRLTSLSDNTPLSYPTSSAWATKLRDYVFSLEEANNDHQPRFRNEQWRDVFENQVSLTPFTAALAGGINSLFSLPLGEEKVKWHVWLDQEALWSRVRTLSHFAVLKGEKLEVCIAFFISSWIFTPNWTRTIQAFVKCFLG